MTKIMLALALLMIAVLTMGMSQRAVANMHERSVDCVWGCGGSDQDLRSVI